MHLSLCILDMGVSNFQLTMTKEAKDITQQTCVQKFKKKRSRHLGWGLLLLSTREVDSGLVLIPSPENRDENMNVKCRVCLLEIKFSFGQQYSVVFDYNKV